MTHNVYIMPFLCGFALDRGSSLSTPFSIGVSLEITSASGYNRIYRTTGTAIIYYVSSYRVTYDQTNVQSTQKTYLDAEFFTATNGVSDPYSLVFSDPSNYFAGINNFTFSTSQIAQFSFNTTSFALTSSGYVFLNISTLNYRYRSCVSPTIYFVEM